MGCGSYGSWIVRCVELFSNLKTELILVFQETSTAQDHGHPRPSSRFAFWSHGGMLLVQNSAEICTSTAVSFLLLSSISGTYKHGAKG